MAVGQIIVNVYTSRSQIPLQDAFVSVTSGQTPDVKLLGFRTTNQNGATESLDIDAPELELSLSPTDQKAYTICDIKVTHPLYYTMIIKDVQVFANTETLQDVELIPLEENSKPEDRSMTQTIPSQNL